MPRLMTRLRYGLARMLTKAEPSTFSIVPSWIYTSLLNPTFRALTREGYQKSSAFFACISALAFAFPEPPLLVYDDEGDAGAAMPRHGLRMLLKRPMPTMGEAELMVTTMVYLGVGGNAYWHKVRGKAGQVVQLRPYHAGQMIPSPGGENWISHYVYDQLGMGGLTPGLPQVDPADIVHFKWPSPDLTQPWMSAPPILAAGTEVDADVEIGRYVAALLANDAVPRTVLTVPGDRPLDDDEVRRMKTQWTERYAGSNRGGVAILEGGTTVSRLGLNLQELAFDALSKIPESRIASALRVPAIIAGLNVGLEHATYANYGSARQAFTQDTLTPLWRMVASEVSADLLPEFLRFGGVEARFDTSRVASLQEDANAKWKRTTDAWKAGLLKKNEARHMLGQADDPAGDVYYSIPAKPAPAAPALTDEQAPKTFLILQDGSMIELPAGAARITQERAALPARRAVKAGGLDDLSDIEGQIEKAMRRYLRAEYRKAATAILNMDKASDPLDPGVVEQLGLDLGPGATRIMHKFYPKVLQRAFDDAGFALDLDLAFDQANDKVQEVLKDLAKLVTRIADTTREAIRALIGHQAAEGWSLQRLAKEIVDSGLVVSQSRAKMIARTETAAAYSQGSMLAYTQSDLVNAIEWIATIDEDTCEDCKALNGTTTKLGKAFADGSTAPPRHPNCRCAIAPVLK